MEIHQILVGAGYGDAITTEALQIRRLLRRVGPSHIYSHYIDPRVPDIRPLSEYERTVLTTDNLLLAHVSIGEQPVFDFLMRRRERLVVRYHNITPARFYDPYDPDFAHKLERGHQELALLRDRAAHAVAVSSFNAGDLADLGYRSISVVPLLMDLRELRQAVPELPAVLGLAPPGGETPVVLFVGRLSPNKNHVGLLQAFHALRTYLEPQARLIIVGSAPAGCYTRALETYAAELALPEPVFTGPVGSAVLSWLYRRADVFLCLSRHEGFCAPLVEAMSFDCPVVAADAGAVAETLGDGGILLDTDDPLVGAEAVRTVFREPGLRAALVEQGRRRAETFWPERVEAALLQELLARV